MGSDHMETPTPSSESGTGAGSANTLRRFNRLGCVLLPLILVAVAYISYHVSARSAERALEAEIARLRAAGIIVPVEDLIPRVPPGERNAADVYEQAFAAFQPPSPEDEKLLLSDPWDAPARRLVEQNETYFALLEEAASLHHCAWPLDWSRPDEARMATIPRDRELLHAAIRQGYRAQAFVAARNPDAALRSAATMLHMAAHVQEESSRSSQLRAHFIHEQFGDTIRTVLSAADPSAEACRDLFDLVAGIDNTGASVRALKGELATWALPQLQNVHARRSWEGEPTGLVDLLDNPDMSWQDRVALRGVAVVGNAIISEDIIHYLQYQEKLVEAYSLPWPESRSALRAAAAEFEAVPAIQSLLSRQMAAPKVALGGLVRLDSRTARLHAAQVALAAAAYRAEHGRYPDSIDDLAAAGWDLPADPFGGGGLHYRLQGNGFVVWSVGPNLADDHAVEYAGPPMSVEDGPYDIVFRCERSLGSQQGDPAVSAP
jgi:hypothetical protein